MAFKPGSVISIVFVALALLFLFFGYLSGRNYIAPFGQTFYVEAELELAADDSILSTQGLPVTQTGAYRWTPWGICGVGENGRNINCQRRTAAPFEPTAFLTESYYEDSDSFRRSEGFYKTATRTVYAFFLIAIIFAGFSFITSALALCSRIGSFIAACTAFAALIADIVLAALLTSVWIYIRNDFRQAGIPAHLGVKMQSWVWASVASLFIASIGFAIGCCTGGDKGGRRRFGRKQRTVVV